MKNEKLVDAIGMISDEYIEEAHSAKNKKRTFAFPWKTAGKIALAACAFLLFINILPFGKGSSSSDAYVSYHEYESYDSGAYYYEADNAAIDEEKTAESAKAELTAKKLIVTGTLHMNTRELEPLSAKVVSAVEKYSGYIQSSEISGSSYRAVIRIPADSYQAFLNEIETEGDTTSYSETVQDITTSYADIEARLTALRAQEERVIALYEKAENVTELIDIEERLSEIRYEIEYYDAQLKNYDLLTTYSTLNLYITETKISNPTRKSFPSRLKDAFISGFENFLYGMEDLIIDFVYYFFVLAFFACLAFLGYFIYSRIRRKLENRK